MSLYSEAISLLCPNANFTVKNNEIFLWDSPEIPRPSYEEINAKVTELQAELPMKILREERNRLLAELDWTQGKDVPDVISNKYTAYRQALRDLPSTASPTLVNGVLLNVTWPTKPD